MLIRNKFNGFSFDGSRRAFMGGGGGGGGQAPAPSSQRVEQTSIPDYARPYVEAMLGKTAALTDINQNPYQPYAGQRVAGFTPMQAQGFENVANQQVAGQIGEGSNIASQVGQTAMGAFGQGQQLGQAAQGYGGQGAGYGAMGAGMSGMGFGAGQRFENMATSPGATQAFMSPYMQNVVDYQKQNAIRDYGIASQGRNAQAVKSGAFGGSRQAVAEGEANRALMNQLGGIQATGTQQAFENAQKQMQFGADLGLRGMGAGYQGLGLGIQGAQTGLQGVQGAVGAGQYGLQGLGEARGAAQLLGQLGQAQFGQQRDITNDMMRAGAVQQGQQQQGLDVAYQDFTKAQNYPYQQLAFGSDMLRGLPLSQAAMTQYTAPPNQMSQLGGLGTTALGIYGMSGGFKANGGMVGKGYAEGGQIGYAGGGDISSLNIEQLTKMLENPRLDPMEVAMIEERIMLLTRMKNNPEAAGIMAPRQTAGIDSIPTGDMVPEQMAGGGIVAFSKGGDKGEGIDSIKNASQARQSYREQLEREVLDSMKRLKTEDPFKESRAQDEAIRAQIGESKRMGPYEALTMAGLRTMAGTSPYALANIGAGGEEGLKTYGRSKREEADLQKQLLQQGVEREKSQFSRQSQLLGAQQTALGQLYGKEADIERTQFAKAQLGQGRETQNLIAAQRVFDNALKAEKTNLFQQNKAKFNMDYSSPELDAEATANVMSRLTPGIKNMLFPDGLIAPASVAKPVVPVDDKKQYPKPSGAAVKQLRDSDNSQTRGQFDAIFGPGAAQRALGK
jgi:hypothetical protein